MSIKYTTGEWTKVYVANGKGKFAEIKVATKLDASQKQTTTPLKAIGDQEIPVAMVTELGEVSGSMPVILTSDATFEALIVDGDPLSPPISFSLSDVVPVCIARNFMDKVTKKYFAADWITNAIINNNGANVAVGGTLAADYSFSGLNMYSFKNFVGGATPEGCQIKFATAGAAMPIDAIEWKTGRKLMPWGRDDNGDELVYAYATLTGFAKLATGGVDPTVITGDIIAYLSSTP
jgi:hypothetical protein